MGRSAVFVDRDGTIIEDAGHIGNPDQIRLLPSAAEALRCFSRSGYLVVLISNQSGIARGLFDEDALRRVHARLEELLEREDFRLDGTYYCPFLAGPAAKVAAFRADSDLRKPKPGMLLQAADELGIELPRSWMIGDASRDVEAGSLAGCQTILVGGGGSDMTIGSLPTYTVQDLLEAVDVICPEARREAPMKDDHPSGRVESETGHAPADNTEVVALLGEIRDQLDRANRRERQHDFSILRLFGALLQMFAIVAAVWGAMFLADDQDVQALSRLMLACFFQLASVSAFAIDKFR